MREDTNVYQAYMLRIWRTLCQGKWQWRASLENPHTGERLAFASLEQCFKYLHGQFSGQVPGSPEEELNHPK